MGNIFQEKVNKILGDNKNVKKFINYILVLRKEIFSKKIDHLKVILSRICAEGLKLNTPKRSFGLKEITYLGYVITQR